MSAHDQTLDSPQDYSKLFELTFMHAPIGIALVAPDGGWIKVNKTLCDFCGYAESELLGKTFQDITYPDDLTIDLDHLQDTLAGKISGYSMEKRYVTKTGQILWAKLQVALVRKPNGKPDFFISHIENIQAQKNRENELKATNRELEKMNSLMMNRELKMIELKRELHDLKAK